MLASKKIQFEPGDACLPYIDTNCIKSDIRTLKKLVHGVTSFIVLISRLQRRWNILMRLALYALQRESLSGRPLVLRDTPRLMKKQ